MSADTTLAAPATPSREEEMLAELAELDMALARHVQAKALAAEEPDEINALGRTYQRVARSLRQTLALKARLVREREAAGRAPAEPKTPAPRLPRWTAAGSDRRRKELREAILRIAETEAEIEREDRPDFELALHDLLVEMSVQPDFLETHPQIQIIEICEVLELPSPIRHRRAPAGADTS
jgi:hypothetical protein